MSVRVWQLAGFGYVVLLVLVALELPLALNLAKRVDAEIKAEAANQAQLVASSAAGGLQRRARLRRLTSTAGRSVGGRVIVVDARGRLLADSAGSPSGTLYASRPEVEAALRGAVSQGTRFSRDLDQELLYSAVPVLEGGEIAGAVRITQSVDAVRGEVRRDVLALVALGIVALGLGLVVAWVLAGHLTRPLRDLTATARRVQAGELDASVPESGAREHREVAQAFNAMTARLGRSLIAQRDFVSNAAHQLRTPLTGLRLRLEAAALKSDDPALLRDLEAAEREAQRLARTVTDLLVLAREEERPPSVPPLVLRTAAEEAYDRWSVVADEHGCELGLDDRSANVSVAAPTADMAQILDNLIENAIEHSPARGAVAIELRVDGSRAVAAVTDEGSGLDEDERARVFERFYRGGSSATRPAGSGLGLTIVRTLARRWGGDAVIENRPERGARAAVWLPIAHGRSARSDPSRDTASTEALAERG